MTRQAVVRLRATLQPHSLRTRLLVYLGVAIALVASVQAGMAYRTALAEADTVFDYHMQQTAQSLRGGLPIDPDADADIDAEPVHPEHGAENFDFVVQIWAADGQQLYRSTRRADLPDRAVLGLFHRAGTRQQLPRVFPADAAPGDPGGARPGRAPPHGAQPGAAHRGAGGLVGADAAAGSLVGGGQLAGAAAAPAQPVGTAPCRRPGPARRVRAAARRDSATGARAGRAVRPAATGLWRTEALCRRRRARAALAPGSAEAADPGPGARTR